MRSNSKEKGWKAKYLSKIWQFLVDILPFSKMNDWGMGKCYFRGCLPQIHQRWTALKIGQIVPALRNQEELEKGGWEEREMARDRRKQDKAKERERERFGQKRKERTSDRRGKQRKKRKTERDDMRQEDMKITWKWEEMKMRREWDNKNKAETMIHNDSTIGFLNYLTIPCKFLDIWKW